MNARDYSSTLRALTRAVAKLEALELRELRRRRFSSAGMTWTMP
jgi:hypothetical protein